MAQPSLCGKCPYQSHFLCYPSRDVAHQVAFFLEEVCFEVRNSEACCCAGRVYAVSAVGRGKLKEWR